MIDNQGGPVFYINALIQTAYSRNIAERYEFTNNELLMFLSLHASKILSMEKIKMVGS